MSNEIRTSLLGSVMCIRAPIRRAIMWTCGATWHSAHSVSCLSSVHTGIATWEKVRATACKWDKYSCFCTFYFFIFSLHCQPNHRLVCSSAFFHSLQPYFPRKQVLNGSLAASPTCVCGGGKKWEEEHCKESSGRFSVPSIKLVVLLLLSPWELNKNAHQNLKASARREDDFHLWSSINGSVNRGGGCVQKDWQENSQKHWILLWTITKSGKINNQAAHG